MKELRKNKKFVLGGSLVLTFIMILSATFAWFSQTDKVDNEFKTGGIPQDSVKVWEIFEEPEEWLPGQEVNKDVGVINRGTMPVVVRASFSEVLQKMKANGTNTDLEITKFDQVPADMTNYREVPTNDWSTVADWQTAEAAGYTVTGMPAGTTLYVKKYTQDNKEYVDYAAISDTKGLVTGDFKLTGNDIAATNVKFNYYEKAALAQVDWTAPVDPAKGPETSHLDNLIELSYHAGNVTTTATANKWIYNAEDGWFYYVGVLNSGEISPFFLDSVKLNSSANNTYQYMDYTLTITAEGLQATKQAVKEQWNLAETNPIYQAIAAELTE